jgi:hypothetical protein
MKRYPLAFGLGLLALLAPGAGLLVGAEPKARVDGLWEGVIVYRPAQIELDLTVEIAADPLVGTIDIPVQGLKFLPLLNLKQEGSRVAFEFDRFPDKEGPEGRFEFRGELSPDGRRITGECNGRNAGVDLRLPFQLERRGDAGRERPPEVRPPLTPMSDAGDELRAAFNRDKDKIRLVLLLSPTCPSCLSSAWVVEKYVLDPSSEDDLRVYVVWGPMMGGETEQDAREATARMSDPRVAHFWTAAQVVAAQFGRAIALPERELGWDTFQLFAPGATWGESVPAPESFMYINKSLPQEVALNAEKLSDWVRSMRRAAPQTQPTAGRRPGALTRALDRSSDRDGSRD